MGPLLILLTLGTVSCELLETRDLLTPALSPSALLSALSPGTPRNQSVTAGDLSQALSTMHFHRSMMNEFLCHNYLADEILTELRPLERRLGEPVSESGHGMTGGEDEGLAPPLLSDPGSKAYSEWLDKSAKLQEMYGQSAGSKASDQMGYETGHVTGYATMHNSPSFAPPPQSGGGWGWSGAGGGWNSGTGGGGWNSGPSNPGPGHEHGGGGGWSGNGNKGWFGNSGYGVSGGGWEEHESGKGLALKELFDLALTALAFLAFGLFVINLIMTCFTKSPNINVMIPPNGTDSVVRRKRESASQLNELAYRVLTSVDKLMELQEQSGGSQDTCLEYTLCDNNKYSRALNDKNKIWLPVWSLGVSWLADGQRSLDSVRASVLGLGGADCAAIYHQCSSTTANNTPRHKHTRFHHN